MLFGQSAPCDVTKDNGRYVANENGNNVAVVSALVQTCPNCNKASVLAVGWKHRAKYAIGWESIVFFFFLDSVRLLLLSPQQQKISLWNLFKVGTFNIKEQRVGETKSGGGGVTSGITGIQFRPKMSPSGSTFSFQITETSTWKKASASHLMSWGKKRKKEIGNF